MLMPDEFSIATAAQIEMNLVVRNLERYFPNELVTSEMKELTLDSELKAWKMARNVLTHRGQLPRRCAKDLGSETALSNSAEWMGMGISVDEKTTVQRRLWLAARLTKCVKATEGFVASMF